MISEGHCDTEDWSNDSENTVLHHRNKLHFKIYSNWKQFLEIEIEKTVKSFHNTTDFNVLFCAALVNRRDIFSKRLRQS